MAGRSGGTGLVLVLAGLFGIPLLHCGTEEQKKKWLPRLTDADFVPATAALIEPRWDWSPHALSTSVMAAPPAKYCSRKCVARSKHQYQRPR